MEQTNLSLPKPELDTKVLTKVVINFMKRDILERYKQTREITDEDGEFCELIDWHPVDELPAKPEHITEMEKARKGSFVEFNSVDEIFEK